MREAGKQVGTVSWQNGSRVNVFVYLHAHYSSWVFSYDRRRFLFGCGSAAALVKPVSEPRVDALGCGTAIFNL